MAIDDLEAARDRNLLAQRRRRARLRARDLGLPAGSAAVTFPAEALQVKSHRDVLALLNAAGALAITDDAAGPNQIAKTLVAIAAAATKCIESASLEQLLDDAPRGIRYEVAMPPGGAFKCATCAATPIPKHRKDASP